MIYAARDASPAGGQACRRARRAAHEAVTFSEKVTVPGSLWWPPARGACTAQRDGPAKHCPVRGRRRGLGRTSRIGRLLTGRWGTGETGLAERRLDLVPPAGGWSEDGLVALEADLAAAVHVGGLCQGGGGAAAGIRTGDGFGGASEVHGVPSFALVPGGGAWVGVFRRRKARRRNRAVGQPAGPGRTRCFQRAKKETVPAQPAGLPASGKRS